MYIAMNRFLVPGGAEEAFEERWRLRTSYLHQLPGFIAFHLLRGAARGDCTLFASHTTWTDEAAFRNWTQSDQFRASHAAAATVVPLHRGEPEFEGFHTVQTLSGVNADRALA